MSQNNKYPNLLIIGAMKCGTTSLHNYLAQHPDIYMTHNKEPQFFCKDRDEETIKWYTNLFNVNHKYFGESSIDYTKCHIYCGIPERIKKVSPNVKLIYIVRDPIKRMISEYNHLKWRGDIDSKVSIDYYFEDFTNTAIQTSNYYKQIAVFLDYFDKNQILFLTNEELNKSPYKLLNKVTKFLDVEGFPSDFKLKRYNVSKNKLMPKRYMKAINRSLFIKNGNKLKGYLKRIPLINELYYTSPILDEELGEELKEKVKEHLRADMKKFADISGIYYNL